MKRYELLLYEQMSKRMRSKLLLLAAFLFVIAFMDLVWQQFLGDFWFLFWIAFVLVVLWWVYYAFLVRRSGLLLYKDYMVLKGPLASVKLSYGRIHSVTSSHLAQHYDLESLKGRDKAIAKPLYQYRCGFVEMRSFPKAMKKHRRQFPRLLFSPRRRGLLLVVENWMVLSRDLEERRVRWHDSRKESAKEDNRSLAARILDY